MTIPLPTPNSAERSRRLSVDLIRRRALERLYDRRVAIENLIFSLEEYQRAQTGTTAPVIEFSVERKWSSGFAQSQI